MTLEERRAKLEAEGFVAHAASSERRGRSIGMCASVCSNRDVKCAKLYFGSLLLEAAGAELGDSYDAMVVPGKTIALLPGGSTYNITKVCGTRGRGISCTSLLRDCTLRAKQMLPARVEDGVIYLDISEEAADDA